MLHTQVFAHVPLSMFEGKKLGIYDFYREKAVAFNMLVQYLLALYRWNRVNPEQDLHKKE